MIKPKMIKIITKSEGGGHTISMDDAGQKLTIESGGTATVKIDGGAGKMDIETQADITIDSQANLTLKSKGDMKLEATGNLNLKGIELTAEGTVKATLTAPTVSVEGLALTEVKGGIVQIN